MKIELFEGRDGWRWRLKAGNGEILATSEAYSSKQAAERTADMLRRAVDGAPPLHGVPVDEYTGLAAEQAALQEPPE